MTGRRLEEFPTFPHKLENGRRKNTYQTPIG
jgi:hypothetical protein